MKSSDGRKGVKRLNEQQRREIIYKLSQHPPPSKRSLAREYGVHKKSIRNIWDNRAEIEECSALMSEEAKLKTYRASVGRFKDIEDCLVVWIDAMRCASLPVPPSLMLLKAKTIAQELSISDFKASWQWLKRFRERKGLKELLLHGEGGEVDKNDPELLAALDEFFAIVNEYNPEHVYNMDETGLFFQQTPRYTLLMPNEDISTARGAKK